MVERCVANAKVEGSNPFFRFSTVFFTLYIKDFPSGNFLFPRGEIKDFPSMALLTSLTGQKPDKS